MRTVFIILILSFISFQGLSQTVATPDTSIYTFKIQLEGKLPDYGSLKSKKGKATLRYKVLESNYKFPTYVVYIAQLLPIPKFMTYGKVYNVKGGITFEEKEVLRGCYSGSYTEYKMVLNPILFKLSFNNE